MGYPRSGQSRYARYLVNGSSQNFTNLEAYRPNLRGLADVQKVANSNVPIKWPKMPPRLIRSLVISQLLPGNPSSILIDGLWNLMNSMPGFARPLPAGLVNNYRGVRIQSLWEAGKPVQRLATETAATAVPGTRQTGQATQAPGFPGYLTAVVGAGAYLSEYNIRWSVSLSTWRADENVTYGPYPNATTARTFVGRPGTGIMPVPWPKVMPWIVIPHLPQTLFYESGYSVPRPPEPVAPARPRAKPDIPFKPPGPPGPRTKERKLKENAKAVAVLHLVNKATELVDVMDAFYDALPKELKNKHWRAWQRAAAVYRHFDKVDIDTALFNVVWDQLVSDRVWSKIGIDTKVTARPRGSNLGVNRLLSEAYGDTIRDLLSGAKQFTARELSKALGLTIQGS